MKKIFFTIFLLLFFLKPMSSQAVLWSNVVTDMAIHVNEQILIEIRISINAAAKMFAIKQVQSTIQSSLAGASDSPKYIKNYQEFLVTYPERAARIEAINFLTNTMLEGKVDGNYVSARITGNEEGVRASMTYSQYLKNIGRVKIEGDDDGVRVSIEDVCDPLLDAKNGGIFAGNTWACFNEMMNKPINTPIGLSMAAEGYLAQKTAEYKLTAEVKANSGNGFLPVVDVNGNVKLPAGVSAALQTRIATMPVDSITDGDNSAAFSNMAEAFTVNFISKIVNDGLGKTETSYKNTVSDFTGKFSAAYAGQFEKYGSIVNINSSFLWKQ